MSDRLAVRQLNRHRARCGRSARDLDVCPRDWAAVAFAYVDDAGRMVNLPHFARGRRTDPKPYTWRGPRKALRPEPVLHVWPVAEARAFALHLMSLPAVEILGRRAFVMAWLHVGPQGRRVQIALPTPSQRPGECHVNHSSRSSCQPQS